jgi:hypothetical protein
MSMVWDKRTLCMLLLMEIRRCPQRRSDVTHPEVAEKFVVPKELYEGDAPCVAA